MGTIAYPLFLKEFYRQLMIVIDTEQKFLDLPRFYIYGNLNKQKLKELVKEYIFKGEDLVRLIEY
jgi:hypothetical protein